MLFLADTTPPVSPAQWGVTVIILMQLGQFVFAFLKHQRGSEAAKKEDLTALKKELKDEITSVKTDVDELKDSVEKKMEDARKESSVVREKISTSIKGVEVQLAGVLKGQQITEQTLNQLSHKVDVLNQRSPRRS